MSRLFSPVEKKSPKYREAAYQAIKSALLEGKIGYEQPLIEEQIAADLQISRTPVREALAILEHEQLLSPHAGRGVAVHQLTPKELNDLITANEILEPVLIRRAAHLITEETLQLLTETLQRQHFYALEGNFICFWQQNIRFHQLIGSAAENDPSSSFMNNNYERIALHLYGSSVFFKSEAMASLQQQNAALLDALIRRDPDEAVRLLMVYFQVLRQALQGEKSPGFQEDDLFRHLAEVA